MRVDIRTRKLALASLLSVLALPFQINAVEAQEKLNDHPPVADLYRVFESVARRSEQAGEDVLAAGMYEETLEQAVRYGQLDGRYIDTLCRLADTYTRMGYSWRAEPLLSKALESIRQKPSLYNQTVKNALTNYAALMRKSKKDKEAASYEDLCQLLSQKAGSATIQ
ncbi:MAG: hypothetical protein K8F91_19525 [Candidatus Obscuribacterales bacterium]|nr:hypothetical protein [Candidatus Obscuribacterales bacterium]